MPRRPMVRYAKDYELRDVVAVYGQGTWCSWSDIVGWLKTEGMRASPFALGELARMIADFGVLADERIPFSVDPGVAYELAQEHRQTAAVEASLHWVEQMTRLEEENAAGSSGVHNPPEGENRRSA
ncbi:MAG TPA: hypothetical protein VFZ25_18755 [Chloroflexota bacterium]|nr:hypothetical protein [Chloroflexota bacterium]